MAEPPGTIESLQSRLHDLEQRVSALENTGGHHAALAPSGTAPAARPTSAVPPAGPTGLLAVFGRGMLGIAGAYLLRALAASSALPRPLLAALALLFAIGWIIGSARTAAGWARSVYACTAALILAPMLWELTLRFHILTPAAAAFALAAFVAVALAHSLRRSVIPVVWVATATAAGLALALLPATHAILPFALLLAATLAAMEFAAPRISEGSARLLVALAADLAIWIEINAYSWPTAPQTGYPLLSTAALLFPALLLPLISCGFALARGILRRLPLSTFDVVQTTAAFLLGVCALLLFAPAAGTTIVRFAALFLAALFYALAYTRFAGPRQARNCAVLSTWSAALLLAGLWMSLDTRWLSGSLGVAALAAMLAALRLHRLALQFHAALYLTVSAAAAGLPSLIAHALSGPAPAASGPLAAFAAACAVLAYLLAQPQPGESHNAQALHFYLAAAAAAVVATFLIQGAFRLLSLAFALQPHHLAFLRTLVLCLLALALAYAGARRRRPDLMRVGYLTIALVTLKLLVEDLRHGHMEYIAASICLFALTLIALPRVVRRTPPRTPPSLS